MQDMLVPVLYKDEFWGGGGVYDFFATIKEIWSQNFSI